MHLNAYLSLVANPYPGVRRRRRASTPSTSSCPAPTPQPRWKTSLRLVARDPGADPLRRARRDRRAVVQRAARRRRCLDLRRRRRRRAVGVLLAFLGWFAIARDRADAARPARRGRLQRSATSRRRSRTSLLVTDRYPNCRPDGAPRRAPSRRRCTRCGSSGDAHDLRRSRLTRLLPPAARDPAPRLAPPLDGRSRASLGIVNWFATLFRGRPAAPFHRFLARYVRYTLHVYAFLYPRREPVPRLHAARRAATRSTSSCRGAAAAEPLEDRLPARSSSIPAVARERRARLARSSIAAILTWFVALATGSAPWGLRNLSAYALRYGAQLERVPLPPHRPRTRTRARSRARTSRAGREPHARRRAAGGEQARAAAGVTRRSPRSSSPRSGRVAAWLLWRSSRARRCTCRTSIRARLFPARELHRAARFTRVERLFWLADDGRRSSVVLGLFARSASASRASRRPARSAPGCCSGCSASRSSGPRSCRSRCSRCGGARRYGLTTRQLRRRRRSGTGSRSAVEFVFLCARARDRDGARAARRRLVVAARGARVHRRWRSSSRSSSPYLLGGTRSTPGSRRTSRSLERIEHVRHVPVRVLDGHRASRTPSRPGSARAGASFLWDTIVEPPFTPRDAALRARARARPPRARPHLEVGRLVRALRVPERVPDRARDAAARRDGRAGGGAARAARARRRSQLARAAAPERRHAAHGGRGRLGRRSARRTTRRPRRSSSSRSCRRRSSDPNPPLWDYVLLENHPTIMQRIAMAQALRDVGGPVAVERRVEPAAARAARRASPARRRGRARARRSGRRRGSSRAGGR